MCKTSSVALSFLARGHIVASLQLQTGLFLATILTVQALLSAITLLLLWSFLFSRDSSPGTATLIHSLLARDVGSSHVHGDAAKSVVRNESGVRKGKCEISKKRHRELIKALE